MLSRIRAWFASSGGSEHHERLSDYQLSETLGKGAMSEVKRAFHKKSFRTVAIKILTPESRAITAKIERNYRHITEGEIAMMFNHPNIIKAIGWGKDGGRDFIVMEYFDGVLLRDLLHEGRLNPAQNRLDIFLSAADALQHIHSKGIVHRDFCPRNILVNAEGLVKVFDFGLSVELEMVKTMRGNRTGTLAYMAPELIKRQFTDQRCDIYALGVTMYEMFAGQRPFLGIDNIARLMQLMNQIPEPPSKINHNVSPELERIILKAIAKDPNKRYTVVQEMIDELNPIVESERPKWNVSPPTPDTTILAPKEIQGYREECLTPAYTEHQETRTWNSSPDFESILNPLNRGDNSGAAREAERLAAAYPDLDLIYWWWAKAHIASSALDDAREVLLQGVSAAKQKWLLCSTLGEVEWRSGNMKQAVYWWAQAFHCQESLPDYGGDCGAYLYLYYVADALGMADCASIFIVRSDQTRPGQIRLSQPVADGLRGSALQSRGLGIESVLGGLRAKYFGGPRRETAKPVDAADLDSLIRDVVDMKVDWEVRIKAANRLGEIGDPKAVPALMKATRDLSLSVQDAAEKALRRIQGDFVASE